MNPKLGPQATFLLIMIMELTAGGQRNRPLSPCERLDCGNNSVCMETISSDGSDSIVKCKCSAYFTGSNCQFVVGLQSHSVTSNSAKLEIIRHRPNDSGHNFPLTKNDDSQFTILYWTNFSTSACAIVPDVKSGALTIGSLQSGTHYTFCAVSGIAEFCHSYAVEADISANCVYTTTLERTEDYQSPTYIAPLVIAIVFVIGLCILLAVIIKKRYIECFYKYQSCLHLKKKSDTTNLYNRRYNRRKGGNSRQHLMPLPLRPLPDIVIHPPASPGRLAHKLSHSTRGYTSTFSAQNETILPLTTVIEDTPTTDTHWSADTSLILHEVDTHT